MRDRQRKRKRETEIDRQRETLRERADIKNHGQGRDAQLVCYKNTF